MAEALQVIIMTNGVLGPIPVQYNTYILHLMEAFHDMQGKIDAANTARIEMYDTCNQVSQDFKTITDEWVKREAQYKAEVKRLEVIIARTSRDGLETVALARTNSVMHRGEPDPRQFVARLQELRSQEARHGMPSNTDSVNEYDAFLGPVPSTGTNFMKAFQSIENAKQAANIRDSRLGCKLHITAGSSRVSSDRD